MGSTTGSKVSYRIEKRISDRKSNVGSGMSGRGRGSGRGRVRALVRGHAIRLLLPADVMWLMLFGCRYLCEYASHTLDRNFSQFLYPEKFYLNGRYIRPGLFEDCAQYTRSASSYRALLISQSLHDSSVLHLGTVIIRSKVIFHVLQSTPIAKQNRQLIDIYIYIYIITCVLYIIITMKMIALSYFAHIYTCMQPRPGQRSYGHCCGHGHHRAASIAFCNSKENCFWEVTSKCIGKLKSCERCMNV